MMESQSPLFIVRLLHSIPHINITLHRVNDTFNLKSDIYLESLGILASIPAALLILSLIGLLLYLLTRCCDRKSKKVKSIGCQKCTLVFVTILCCAAIGLGLYGNDDLHNGLLQVIGSGRKVVQQSMNVRNQTEHVRHTLKTKITIEEIDDSLEHPTHNMTGLNLLMDTVVEVKKSKQTSIDALEAVLHHISSSKSEVTLKYYLNKLQMVEEIRWPVTLGYLTFLLFLCTVLMIGVARSSRCLLIFFSVFGLLAVTVCWLLSGIYLAGSVALADFCMKPTEFICTQPELQDVITNCGKKNPSVLRLNESKDSIERAKETLRNVSLMGQYLDIDIDLKVAKLQNEFENCKSQIMRITQMLDHRSTSDHNGAAIRGFCHSGSFGLALMLIASLISAFLLTILVCVDSHTWIYLTKKRPYEDKSETTPLFPSGSSVSPTAPITSGSSTINRTLLHAQHHTASNAGTAQIPMNGRNGTTGMRGLAYNKTGESPPPDYSVVVHGNRASGHHTLGRLPSQAAHLNGPNNGKYATLSKQCKTLESNDFY